MRPELSRPGGLLLFLVAASQFGCASFQPERLDQTEDLAVFEEFDSRTDVREWRTQRRWALDGPRSPIGEPVFSVDVVAFEFGEDHAEVPGASGLLLRLHAMDWGWTFLREREIELRIDGSEPIRLGAGEYEGGLRTPEGRQGQVSQFHIEMLEAPMWRDEVARLADADEVEVSVGPHRFRLHPATIEVIGRLLATIPDTVR